MSKISSHKRHSYKTLKPISNSIFTTAILSTIINNTHCLYYSQYLNISIQRTNGVLQVSY